MFRTVLALAFLAASPAPAQEIGPIEIRLDRLVPGTHHIYESSDSGTYSLTYLHGENGGFIIEQREGDIPGEGELAMTIHTDDAGRWLRQIGKDGTEIRYEPHNCLRSLEYCEYEVFINDQPGFPLARQATLTENGLSYELYRRDTSPRQLVQSGTVTLDRFGFMANSTLSRPGAPTQTIERRQILTPGRAQGPLPEPSLILRKLR